MKQMMLLRGLFIPLLFVFATTELITAVTLVEEHGDTIDGAELSARAVGRGRKGVRTHSYREAATELIVNKRIIKEDRVPPLQTHDVIFVIKQRNIDELTRILHDISDPESVNYGQHMSAIEIADLTRNPGSRSSVVKHLKASGASIVSETLYGEYVTARASIHVWEQMFNTEFYTYALHPFESAIKRFVRAVEYSVPMVLDTHVTSVLNTVQMLQIQSPRPSKREFMSSNYQGAVFNGYVYPNILNAAYNIDSNIGHPRATQAVYETINVSFSPSDLAQFQQLFALPLIPANRSIGGHASSSYCMKNGGPCSEGDLDIQYIMAISQSPTTYYYTDLYYYSDFLMLLANTKNPPLVISFSYTWSYSLSPSEHDAFNVQAIKLSAMGVTLVAASGDTGANGGISDTSQCGYTPAFSSTSPYVLSIGATRVCLRREYTCNHCHFHAPSFLYLYVSTMKVMLLSLAVAFSFRLYSPSIQGIEINATEVVCASDTGGGFTSGGGFSSYFGRPSWQSAAVSNYFSSLATAPYPGYRVDGRGYPDLSAAGHNYVVVIGGGYFSTGGTSASTPVVAGMISLVNAARLRAGRSSVGWIHPILYASYKNFTKDITSGNNKCASGSVCCPQGFSAAPGWDPVTGLGVLNFKKFKTFMMSIGNSTTTTSKPSTAPSLSPSLAPSATPSSAPTYTPSKNPSFAPSIQPSVSSSPSFAPSIPPTLQPSLSPTLSPSYTPSNNPTLQPSLAPTLSPSFVPSNKPTLRPSLTPTLSPSNKPTLQPSLAPTLSPSNKPTLQPSLTPTLSPSNSPTLQPSLTPTLSPSFALTNKPTIQPSLTPTLSPSSAPSNKPPNALL